VVKTIEVYISSKDILITPDARGAELVNFLQASTPLPVDHALEVAFQALEVPDVLPVQQGSTPVIQFAGHVLVERFREVQQQGARHAPLVNSNTDQEQKIASSVLGAQFLSEERQSAQDAGQENIKEELTRVPHVLVGNSNHLPDPGGVSPAMPVKYLDMEQRNAQAVLQASIKVLVANQNVTIAVQAKFQALAP
jgi:hypothetical protein